MLNKKIATLSATLLLLPALCQPLALAQNKDNMGLPEIPGVTDSVPGVSNGAKPAENNSPAVNDAWPWMQNDPNAAKKQNASPPAPTPAKTEAATTEAKPLPEAAATSTKLEPEKPKPASEARPSTAPAQRQEERRPEERAASAKPTMLYGRIEELTTMPGAKFPIQLKAQTAKMDPRGVAMKGSAVDTLYSGKLVKSFPSQYDGVWGGKLQVYQMQQDRLYYDVDPDSAKQTAELLKPGMLGQVNLQFEQHGTTVNLEPAQIYFSAPMSESRYSSMMNQMGQGQSVSIPGFGNMPGGMGAMMKSFMQQMPYIFVVNLGNAAGTGVSGNAIQQGIVRNEIRQLSPTVVEQQLVTSKTETNPKTGRTLREFTETVVRVTRYDSMRLYVQAASVDYSQDKRFMDKLVLNGYVTKGAVEQVNPMGGLSLPGMQMPGGANPLQGMPGGQNPFQGLFGQ